TLDASEMSVARASQSREGGVSLMRFKPPEPPTWLTWRRSAEVLRTEFVVPLGWSLESVMYELGDFRDDLAGYRLIVHGAAVIDYRSPIELEDGAHALVRVDGGT